MRHLYRAIILFVSIASLGCGWSNPQQKWERVVNQEVSHLGYRNWIVIAEASFPAHSRQGVKQLVVDAEIPEVVDYVLNSIEVNQHVYPNIYLTRELRAVENDYAPGVDRLREQIQTALHGYKPTEIHQESLLTLIESANQHFNVLVIRSSTTLPYSSVFMELQPGYWDSDAEKRLRQRISQQRSEKLAQPAP